LWEFFSEKHLQNKYNVVKFDRIGGIKNVYRVESQ